MLSNYDDIIYNTWLITHFYCVHIYYAIRACIYILYINISNININMRFNSEFNMCTL